MKKTQVYQVKLCCLLFRNERNFPQRKPETRTMRQTVEFILLDEPLKVDVNDFTAELNIWSRGRFPGWKYISAGSQFGEGHLDL